MNSKSKKHDAVVARALRRGFFITCEKYGSTTLCKIGRSGGVQLLHICLQTGEYLGKNSL